MSDIIAKDGGRIKGDFQNVFSFSREYFHAMKTPKFLLARN
jgi:hypothetical protein